MTISRERIKEIAENMKTQDNCGTAEPLLFWVQQKREIVADPDYSYDGFAWVYERDCEVWTKDEKEARRIHKEYEYEDKFPEGWKKVYYKEYWETVNACFTRKGCEDYLRLNKHNLIEPRIYADHAFRNREWADIKQFILETAENDEVEDLKNGLRIAQKIFNRAVDLSPNLVEECHEEMSKIDELLKDEKSGDL